MAIFRLEAKIIGRRARDKAGKPIAGRSVSVVAKAAYRAGEKLVDEQTEKTYNYRSRQQEVVYSEIVAPAEAPSWLTPSADGESSANPRERLWNEVERAEKRVDSQLAREFIIALPHELDHDQQAVLVRHWCEDQVTSKGFVADFAIHRSKDGNNPHSHVLCTLRPVAGEGFGPKPDMSGKFNERGSVGHGAKSDLVGWRESWEIHCNAALEEAGYAIRIDHRSLTDQGIDREPEPKIGVEATAMQRRGAEEDPDRVRDARQVRMENEMRSAMNEARRPTDDAELAEPATHWYARMRESLARAAVDFKEFLRDESSGGRRSSTREWQEQDVIATASDSSTHAAGPSPLVQSKEITPPSPIPAG